MNFFVSVIIPVYNVASFVEKAVISACTQPEVSEVIIINDGSTDNTLKIIKKLQKENNIIKVFSHFNEINKGRSATRNLGIQKATNKYIAFLDADDYYEDNRFSNDKTIFETDSSIEGVYNAVGFQFYRSIDKNEKDFFKLNTLTQKVAPENLYEALITSKYGYLHLNGLTLKRDVINKIGYFNESLKVAEDSYFLFKLALKVKLVGGILDRPLAKRGIHDSNVFDKKALYQKYTIKMYETLVIWCSKNKVANYIIDDLFKRIWLLKQKEKNRLYKDITHWAGFFYSNPKLLFSIFSIKYFPIIRFRKMLFPFFYKR
ncbi:glycosyltransferase family 2 protein [Litoribaculum gwangyangense]|uniref:Glycosyltransferase family 2 protein n=1 Tax=Litoribaculum gwangyangense TaxID=1130722 RepID=A0ABP9CQU1_9FLAO